MKIVIDALGSDKGYEMIASGLAMAMKKDDTFKAVLVGPENKIKEILKEEKVDFSRLEFIDTDVYIENEDEPVRALRKKKNSTTVLGLNYINNEGADGFISAGSTGALLAGSLFITKRINNVERAFLAAILPNGSKGMVLADTGANMDTSAQILYQFAQMASIYSERFLKISNPRLGLLNVGVEAGKGNKLSKETYNLLQASKLNFIGNIEAREVLNNACDILITDGFAGNVLLKSVEGTASTLIREIKSSIMSSFKTKIGGVLIKPAMKEVLAKYNSKEYGGAALLGVKVPIYKAHGNSDAGNFRNAILEFIDLINSKVVEEIKLELEVEND